MEILFNKHDHFEITDALKQYAEKKIVKAATLSDKINITRIVVSFNIEKLIHTAEATIHVAGNHDFHASSSSKQDMYSAIDLLSNKVERQINEFKERIKTHRE